ncbi:hypothetical protein GUJ93_ZPchr0001g32033 [Zizania palustris]|uniref:BHLH domain-containing protein n=1 Tax=Zizania palustris TaxID=103762 RepID=A0A8J5RHT0_ZIZPA|nr:hypothetical protein GUJ93_ZPchr0001g32033 [Zizania palustris]
MMASSSSSSSLCDHLLQDDLPWPASSMPCAPALALHSIGASHQWNHSHPLLLNQLNSHELESLLSVEGHLHGQLAAAPTTGSGAAEAHQLSTVLMMQELGFQWSNDCGLADDDAAAASISMNHNKPRPSSSSCGAAATTTTYCGAGDMVGGNLGGSVLPTINVSRLQKPPPAGGGGDASLEEMLLLASCSSKILQAAAAASMVAGYCEQHLPSWPPYGPPPPAAHLIQAPSISSSIDDAHKLQMGASGSDSNTAAATAGGGGGGAEGRGGRHGIAGEHRSSSSPPSSKKPRMESSRSSSSSSSSMVVPSFKVRKEKLGDRIAALQQLVSPFGKTDTASVLMEAIGYIKFLQDQVETLSGPYLQRSSKKACSSSRRAAQELQKVAGEEEGAAAAGAKLDLRSRGLCLVPLSCTSYVTNENGVWAAPPNFRGN